MIYAIAGRAVTLRTMVKVGDRLVKDLPHKELVNLVVGKDTFAEPRDEGWLKLTGLRVGEAGPIDLSVRSDGIVGLCGLRGAGQGPAGRVFAGSDRATGDHGT